MVEAGDPVNWHQWELWGDNGLLGIYRDHGVLWGGQTEAGSGYLWHHRQEVPHSRGSCFLAQTTAG